jgi:hypothetical protein
LTDGFLQLFVLILCATDKSYRGHAEPIAAQTFFCCVNNPGMIGQPEIIICTEIDHFPLRHTDISSLGSKDLSLALEQSGGTYIIQLGLDESLEGSKGHHAIV